VRSRRFLGADADFVGPTAASNTLPAFAETLRYTPNDKLMKAPTKPPMKKNIVASRMKLMIAIPAMVAVADLGINAPPTRRRANAQTTFGVPKRKRLALSVECAARL
jgi:hypothetical protein